MKKWLLLSLAFGMIPWSVAAQDDDMYLVAKKKSTVSATPHTQSSYSGYHSTYYPGSNRDVDEYNRRGRSYYEVIAADTAANDIINFSAVEGVYPDSLTMIDDDYALTRSMNRWDGYEPGDTFWAGYSAGRRDAWDVWHSPWYYSSYYPWYDSWYNPWYYGYYGYYGWYDPWYYGYYGYYGPYYYDRWYYPYYYSSWVAPRHYTSRGLDNAGTISRLGSNNTRLSGYRGNTASGAGNSRSQGSFSRMNASRQSSLRNSTVGNHRAYEPGRSNTTRNNSTTSNVVRSTSSSRITNSSNATRITNSNASRATSNSSYTPSRSSSGSSFGGSSSSGSFSGGASRSSGGGGGGGRLGGRR